jgi:hypothetical protein
MKSSGRFWPAVVCGLLKIVSNLRGYFHTVVDDPDDWYPRRGPETNGQLEQNLPSDWNPKGKNLRLRKQLSFTSLQGQVLQVRLCPRSKMWWITAAFCGARSDRWSAIQELAGYQVREWRHRTEQRHCHPLTSSCWHRPSK